MDYEHKKDNPSEMVGKTFKSVKQIGNDTIEFVSDTETWTFTHDQDCCESVNIEDVNGDLSDLEGSPITLAEQVSSEGVAQKNEEYPDESFTWTFYRFATVEGYVTIRWYGTSNGYYSERVDIYRVPKAASKKPEDKEIVIDISKTPFSLVDYSPMSEEDLRKWSDPNRDAFRFVCSG